MICCDPFWFLSKISNEMNCKFKRLRVRQAGPISCVRLESYSRLESYIGCFTDVKVASGATREDYH
jgi:hypothetical protein